MECEMKALDEELLERKPHLLVREAGVTLRLGVDIVVLVVAPLG